MFVYFLASYDVSCFLNVFAYILFCKCPDNLLNLICTTDKTIVDYGDHTALLGNCVKWNNLSVVS